MLQLSWNKNYTQPLPLPSTEDVVSSSNADI